MTTVINRVCVCVWFKVRGEAPEPDRLKNSSLLHIWKPAAAAAAALDPGDHLARGLRETLF